MHVTIMEMQRSTLMEQVHQIMYALKKCAQEANSGVLLLSAVPNCQLMANGHATLLMALIT
jgi:hypothetical protein